MKLITNIKKIYGIIYTPGDKSISHRAIMFGSISYGITIIKNFLYCKDCLYTLNAFKKLGIKIIINNKFEIKIFGNGFNGLKCSNSPIYVGNSATTIRLLSGILVCKKFKTELFGDKSLSKRPMDKLIFILNNIGAKCYIKKNMNLVVSGGKLNPIINFIPIVSAQLKSALLFSALQIFGKSIIIEKLYTRNHTENMIKIFGGKIKKKKKKIIIVGPQKLIGKNIIIPGDISAASFFLVAGLIIPNSYIICKNVNLNFTRNGILDIIFLMKGILKIKKIYYNNYILGTLITKYSKLYAININYKIIPRLIDEIPIISLMATQAFGVTTIEGIENLKFKETNRIKVIISELSKMGANIKEVNNILIIKGKTFLKSANVSSFGDHRIEMMLNIAALLVKNGSVNLKFSNFVLNSYPNFYNDLKSVIVF